MKLAPLILSAALLCVLLPVQAQTPVQPASVYSLDGIRMASPKQAGWTVISRSPTETSFEKQSKDGILHAGVKTLHTQIFSGVQAQLAGWEKLKQAELSHLKLDSVHYFNEKFKGAMCLHYDGVFPTPKTQAVPFAYLNLKGYLCPHPKARDQVVQIEFSDLSNTRGFTEALFDLSAVFFESITFPGQP